MNTRQLLLGAVLLGFVGLTGQVLVEHGYLGFFLAVGENSATRLVMVDLVICLSLMAAWIWTDARSRDINPLPYLGVALAFGAAGPLLYLIVRERRAATAQATA